MPRELQQKVLLFGITFALVLRTVFILVGAAAIENFSWVFYLFGAILIYTAWARPAAAGTTATRTTRRTPSSGSPAGSCRRRTSTTPTG